MGIRPKHITVGVSQAELEQRNRALALLLHMSDFLAGVMDPENLLQGVLSRVLTYFRLDAGRIYLLDKTGQYLHLTAWQGLEPQGLKSLHISEGFSGKAARTKTFIAQDISELEDTERAAFLARKGLQSVICVPLITADRVGGVMNLASRRPVTLEQSEIDLLTTIGNQIAVALSQVRLYQELRETIRSLGEKNETIKFFAYSVSHDLKSPAVGLYGLTRRLYARYGAHLDQKGRECCRQILRAAEQMVSLVEKINAYVASKEAPLILERIHMKELSDETREAFSEEMRARGIKWSEPEDLPQVIGDRLSLSRVFRNLVDNALKYGGPDLSEIRIDYVEEDAYHTFSVSDDGIGIKAESGKRIFDMFHRNENARGKPGSGLGLTIIKQIIDRHGGRTWLDTSGPRGTSVFVTISKDLEVSS
jgi:signal transduction histidine kinase